MTNAHARTPPKVFPLKSNVKKWDLKLQINSIRSTVAAQLEEFFLVCQIKYRTNNSQLPHPVPKGMTPVHITTIVDHDFSTVYAKDWLTLKC
jgi:hypothetical protein